MGASLSEREKSTDSYRTDQIYSFSTTDIVSRLDERSTVTDAVEVYCYAVVWHNILIERCRKLPYENHNGLAWKVLE